MANRELEALLNQLDQAFDRRSWHGPNLAGSLRGLTVEEALFRPAPGRNSVWELVVHSAYWKYAVRRRISDAARGSFAHAGSNFFPRPDERGATEKALKEDLALLRAEHEALRATVAALPPRRLGELSAKKKWTLAEEIAGVAAHDVYHAGQIQLLRKLFQKG